MKDVLLRLLIFAVVSKIYGVATDFMDTKCDRRHFGWGST